MAPVIIAKDLYKCYPGFPPVLRGVNISVVPGEMVAIMGPSGCGKSTMLHVLGMLHAPDAGTLEVLGTDVLTLTSEEVAAFRRGNMGFVMQSSNLFDHSTVFENVEFPLIYEKIPPEERWERVIRALELVRLSHRVNYRSNRLSGGEQQRVAIARAMVNNPRILLADEPTGALDARTSRVVMENFRTLAHEGGVAMVVVTHDPNVAEYCDSVYTLEDGVLVCQRQDAIPPPSGEGIHLLGTAPRRLAAACVVGHFPEPCGTVLVQDALNLHDQKVLARVYSLYGAGLAGLSQGDSQGLPVPMRRQGMWTMPVVLWGLLRCMRRHSGIFWRMWKSAPLRQRMRSFLYRLRAFAVGVRMASWCVDDGIEHIHALTSRSPALSGWVASRLTGIPFSFSVRGGDLNAQDTSAQQIIAMAHDAAFVRCDTEYTRKLLQAEAALSASTTQDKFVLLRDPLTLPKPNEEDSMPVVPVAGAVQVVNLLAAGCLEQRKGIRVLLRACAILRKQGVSFHLEVVGTGRKWAKKRFAFRAFLMGLRKYVTFTGLQPHDNLAEAMRKAAIFISPAVHAGGYDGQWPAALGEAMVYGLPVVVSDIPAHVELVHDKHNGVVVPVGDAAALAEALLHVMRFPEEAQQWGRTAQTDICEYLEEEGKAHKLADILLETSKVRRQKDS